MILIALAAVSVEWATLPDAARCTCGYVGWRLDEAQIIELDRRLELPPGADPHERYDRYYAGHIAPDGTKTLFVALVFYQPLTPPPGRQARTPGIHINYRANGRASVPRDYRIGCRLISGTFDAAFKPVKPLVCSKEGW